MFFLISREVPLFKQQQLELMERHVVIDKENHDFILRCDSYIDCTEPYGMIDRNVQNQMRIGGQEVKGDASIEIIKKIVGSVEGSPTIIERQQTMILSTLTTLVDNSEN